MPTNTTEKPNILSTISQYSLYLTVILVIVGLWRISDPNIKLLYSLCMVIGSALGRYGTNISNRLAKLPKDNVNETRRWWAYTILWAFGVFGLIS